MILLRLGLRTAAEMKTSSGRIDAMIELDKHIFIFEFKLGDPASTALQQTKDKGYAEKCRLQGKQITLVGAKFDYKARKLTDWTEAEDGCISYWGRTWPQVKTCGYTHCAASAAR